MATQAPRRNDLFTQLARQSPAAKVVILAVVLLLLGLLYWQFFYKDLRTRKKSLQSTNASLQSTSTQLQQRWEQIRPLSPGEPPKKDPRLIDRYQALMKEAPDLGKALPSDAERNALQFTLQSKAAGAGVTFKSWSHLPEQQVEKYLKVPMAVEVEGTFHKLLDYFRKLGPPPLPDEPPSKRKAREEAKTGAEKLDIGKREWDRIVTIEGLTIALGAVRNDEILLNAKFTASAFRQEEDKKAEPARPAAGAPPAGAAPGAAKPPAGPAGSPAEPSR